MMKHSVPPLLVVALILASIHSAAQDKVDMRAVTSSIKLEEVVGGHLIDLNGKYKLRATEVVIEPGGYLGPHHHAGPGLRYVISGQMTFAQAGTTTHTYSAGDYFAESGNIVHTTHNRTNSRVRVIFFEILPGQWSGPSVIPPKAY